MAKIKLEYDINLWIVGKADKYLRVHVAPGSLLPGQLFLIAQVTLKAGLTKKDEFTLGQDGTLSLSKLGYYNNEKSFRKGLKDMRLDVNDYMVYYKWLSYAKTEGGTFTDAFINTIFRKVCSNKIWINRNWDFDYIK